MKRYFWITVCLLALAIPGYAQVPPVKNPSGVSFTSPDHATVTGYEVDIVNSSAAVVQTIVTGKGTQAVDGTVTLALNVQPIAITTALYTLRIRAVQDMSKSADSIDSDPWERTPGRPSKPVVQ